MKKVHIIASIVALVVVMAAAYFYIIKPKLDNRTVSVVAPVTINYEGAGLSFTYPSGEAGYTLIEPPIPPSTSSGLEKIYIIMDADEYINFEQNDTETPPAVSVFVLKTPKEGAIGANRQERLINWAKENSQFSAFSNRLNEPEETEIDGVDALTYKTENSLYKQKVYLVSYQGYTYVFVGQHQREDEAIYQMFSNLIDSILFN